MDSLLRCSKWTMWSRRYWCNISSCQPLQKTVWNYPPDETASVLDMAATLQIDERHQKAPARLNLVAIKIQLLSEFSRHQLSWRSKVFLQKPARKSRPRFKSAPVKLRIVTFETAPWTTIRKILTSKNSRSMSAWSCQQGQAKTIGAQNIKNHQITNAASILFSS